MNIVIPGEKKKNKQINNKNPQTKTFSLSHYLAEHIWTSVHFMLLQVSSMKIKTCTLRFALVNLSELIQQGESQLAINPLYALCTDLTIAS